MPMFPAHQFGLYPHQRNQMQSAHQRYPSFEAIPPQMGADPDRLYYQSWPHSSNYGYYASPAQFHGCCERSHFPGYSGLGSPYAQPPPPYCHGSYPLPPGAYPVHYISPPPCHTVELPHYEYDKDMNGFYHCCGCLNHPCNRKVGKNVKIEEEGPHVKNEVDGSLVPFNFRNYPNPLVWYPPNNMKNKEDILSNEPQYEKQEDGSNSAKIHYPYPVLWYPPNYVMNKEDNTSNEPQYEKQEDDSSSARTNCPCPLLWFPPTYTRNKDGSVSSEPQCRKPEGSSNGSKTHEISEPSEQQQNFVNGLFPFDMNNLRSSKSRSLRQQQQPQGDDKPGFRCPVFWMPYKPDERESKNHWRTGVGQECARRAPSNFEVSPVMVPETEENNNREMNDEIIGNKGPKQMEKTNIQKTIPVKQADLDDKEKNKEKTKSFGMPLNCSEAGKSSEDGGKRKCPSPPKLSKLPPLCLRVDPLPRKKNANGRSRSPSPPGDKGKSHEVPRENDKPATSLDAKEISQQDIPFRNVVPERAKDKERHKSKTKTIQVSEGTGSQAGTGDSLHDSSHDGVPGSQPKDAVDDLAATDVKCKSVAGASNEGAVEDKSSHCQIDEKEEKSKAEEKPVNKEKEAKRINLSEAEAARIIQSAYRGYEVRRREPLKKLKQVMEVSKKMAELKSSIQVFESSPDIQGVDKWRTVIGETIMNLLLKLDTIQGMHPSIRDVRKSVARELVGLQEKVDYLTQKKADETLTQQASTVLLTENMDNKDDLCIKEGQEEEKHDQENSQLESDPENEFYQEVACQSESNPRIHTVTNSGNLDIPEVVKAEDPRESTTEATTTETELQKGDTMMDAFTTSQNPDIPVIFADEGENSWEQITEATPEDDVSMNELPRGVIDGNTDIQENNFVKNDAVENEVLAESYLKAKELAQLPLGVLDDDDNNEPNKHLHVEGEEDEGKTGAVTLHVNAEVADGGVLNMNQAEPGQEMLLKVPITSEVNENLQCAEDKDNNVGLLEMVDLGSNDAVQAAEDETSVESETVDEPEVHGKEKTGSKAEVFNCAESEVSGCFAEENEIPVVTTTTEPKEGSEDRGEEVSEHESGCTSGGENRLTDASNSSNKDASRECDFSWKLSKSCGVKHEEKHLDDNFELQASVGAAGVDRTFAQTCNFGSLEGELSDCMESTAPKAKQTEEQEFPPSSPSASQISLESDALSEGDRKLIEENMRLREMMQKLIEAGQEQLTAISKLSAKVKDLEKRTSKKKKLKVKRNGKSRSSSGSSCLKPLNDPLREKAVALAM